MKSEKEKIENWIEREIFKDRKELVLIIQSLALLEFYYKLIAIELLLEGLLLKSLFAHYYKVSR